MRLDICTRDDFRCADCGLEFPHPEGWDGSHALFLRIPRPLSPSHGLPWKTIYLELGHNVSWLDGGGFAHDNLRALCSPCNIHQGREARI
jgi:5-methylcytosine-specific restriction endonuclease McrA